MSSSLHAIDLFQSTVDWQGLIGDSLRPVELEIGCGKGLFLQQAARQHSERLFLGLELSLKFAQRTADRLAKCGATNVRILRGDAQQFLHSIVPDQSLRCSHVYFPDPWWRNKHKKRRVLNAQTLVDIERTLQRNGEFHFWTDVADYYEHICSEIMQLTRLEGPMYVPEKAAQHDMDYTTHFERRARLNRQPVYRAVFVKRAASS